MESSQIKEALYETIEYMLEAQLRAIRKIRQGRRNATPPTGVDKRMSQVDMAYNILTMAGQPLHVSEILHRIQKEYGAAIDRESLASALAKKVARQDRFERTGKNTFALRPRPPR